MQLSDIRTEVRLRAGMDANDGMATDATVNSLINAALRQVAATRDWDWLYASETINSVDGTSSYARATGARKTDRILDDVEQRHLQHVSKRQAVRYLDRLPATITNQIPRAWYVENNRIVLVPTPTSARAYTHHYVDSETALSLDTDTPKIPDAYIDIVVIKAALMLTARTDNTSQFRLLKDEERQMMDAMQDEAMQARAPVTTDSRRDWWLR